MRQSSEDTPRAHAKDAIVRMILSRGYKVGDKLPRYRDLTAHLGIAMQTLVRAMHELAEEGTLQLLHGKGVFVRRIPRGSGKLATVGLAYPASQLALLRENYLNQILTGVVIECGQHRLDLQIVAFRPLGGYTPVAPRDLALRVDGLILLGVLNDRYIAECAREAIPLVLVDAQTQAAPVSCIAVDNAQAVNLVMDHLHALGHRRIAYVDFRSSDDLARDGEPFRVDTADTRERREAYLAARQRLGLDYMKVYPPVEWTKADEAPSATAMAAMAALRKDKQPPTAVVCSDEGIARHLCQVALAGRLRVPQDISVAAAVGARGANVVGNQVITCVLADFEAMGVQAIVSLQRQVEAGWGSSLQVERTDGTLSVGTTTGKPRRR